MTDKTELRTRCEAWLTDNEVERRSDGVHYEFQVHALMALLAAERASEAEFLGNDLAHGLPQIWKDALKRRCEARAAAWRKEL